MTAYLLNQIPSFTGFEALGTLVNIAVSHPFKLWLDLYSIIKTTENILNQILLSIFKIIGT